MNSSTIEIVSARWIIPMDCDISRTEAASTLNDHAIAVQDGTIIALAPREQILADYPDAAHTELNNHILMPGLINAHNHTAMTLLRGMADDYPLMEWLEQHIWPAENRCISYDFVRDGTELGIAEMLLSGTTCFSDMYFFPDATAAVAEKLGMRAQINFPIFEMASAWAQNAEEYFDKGLALSDEYRYSPLINTAFGPHAPYTVSDSSFERIVMLAEEIDCNIHVHLHETAFEVASSIEQYGMSPIARLNQLGALSPRTQAVHMTQLNTEDTKILLDTGASVIHCPTSNVKLASGYCPAADLLDQGVRVGLGTDGAASNNTLNLFETLRSAALLAKHQAADATALNASQTLRMATLGGAEVLGIDDITGSITIGKQADMIAIDTHSPAMQPVHSAISQLVYTEAASAVSHVWIAGKIKVSNRQLVDIDLEALLAKSQWWGNTIAKVENT
ncbi:MAG: TRZ/ATZ family hydrolase [Pseudomonadales bacterium]|nr:TRZ/ATZ family hydrolase [Pseudomonadales bacterium]